MAKAERISAVFLVVGGVFIAAYSFHYLKLGILISPGAGFLPFFCGISLIILGILWLMATLLPKPPAPAEAEVGHNISDVPVEDVPRIWGVPQKMLLGVSVLIAYGWLFEKIGYFLSTCLFMFGWQMLVERESLLKAIIITALSAIILYTLFQYLLGIQLPPGLWLP
jgi:putative tricarboxylic transport membrane protein